MKRRVVVVLLLVLATALLLGSAFQASAQEVRTEVSSYEYDCFTGFTDSGGVWDEDKAVMHVRGILHTNVNVSDTPELNGLHSTVADAEFNQVNGNAIIRGTSSWQPDGIAGTWEGHWVVIYNKNIGSGKAVMHGTGALKGKTLLLDVYDAEPDGKLDEMCAPYGEPEGYVRTEGYMLEASGW